MLTAWLTCSQRLFLWVLKIKEKSAKRRYLSPRPLRVSVSPTTCPALLYGIWIASCTVLTSQLISLCLNIPVPAADTEDHPQSLPDVRGWASWRDFFAVPQLPAHSYASHMGMGSYGSRIASVRYASSWQRAWVRSGTNSASAVWEPRQPCHEDLYSCFMFLNGILTFWLGPKRLLRTTCDILDLGPSSLSFRYKHKLTQEQQPALLVAGVIMPPSPWRALSGCPVSAYKNLEFVCTWMLGKASLNREKLSISFPCRAQQQDKRPKVNTSPVNLCPCQSQEGIRLVTSLHPHESQRGPWSLAYAAFPALAVTDGLQPPPLPHFLSSLADKQSK